MICYFGRVSNCRSGSNGLEGDKLYEKKKERFEFNWFDIYGYLHW